MIPVFGVECRCNLALGAHYVNRQRSDVPHHDVVRHAVYPEATVKLLRDAGRQLRPRCVGLRHQTLRLLVLRSRRTAGTTATPATAPTVLRLRLCRGNAAEQRLDCSAHFLLHQVANHREQALLSRHRVLLAAPDTRMPNHQQRRKQASQLQEKHAGRQMEAAPRFSSRPPFLTCSMSLPSSPQTATNGNISSSRRWS
jgi:hypothetical protein